MTPPDSDSPPPSAQIEPTTGRPVLLAPRRQHRPRLTHTDASAAACPFCAGAEQQTTAELDAIRSPESAPNHPGWRARAFPNKYPAAEHHEVIVEGSEHHEQPSALGPAIWADVITLWQRRIAALERLDGVACAFLFKNVGARAGASIVHNHSQLIGLPALPPRLQLERDVAATLPRCPWCAALESADADGRLILRGPDHAVIVPEVPRLPHETWLLPLACADEFLTTDPAALALVLDGLFQAVHRGLGSPALNLWLHRIPAGGFHWHFELQPRSGSLAGLELGADVSINSIPAAVTAAKLRAGLEPR